ncbi:MAG: hypothetical protein IRY85_11815 [Micromonosporaceae bacterium]|nr:hypothetical protein [Micromonosporaceae bacterium]
MSDGTGDAAAGPLPGRQRIRPRSRVDRFAMLVEETGPGRHHHRPTDNDGDLLALVELAHQLGRVRQPTVRDRFREELHARLQAEFARHQLAAPSTPARSIPAARSAPDDRTADARNRDLADIETQVVRQVRPRRSHGRLAVLIGLATGALALSGVSAASGGALPGDPLYSVKRSGEQAQLMLAGSDAARGRLHLDFAHTRLNEARHVAPEEVGAVLAEMDRDVLEGARLLFSAAVESGDVSLIDAVAAFVAQQRPGLLELHASVRLPDDPVRASLDLVDAVEARANELRAALANGCTAIGADRYGPKPAC